MAEFLTTYGTSYYIENIIVNAKSWLVLISPFFNLSKNFYERLTDADRRKVKIILIYGKDELKPNEKSRLQQLENVSLYFCENLHAKCFLNEECMVITSMNIYEYSEKNNREMGVLIRKEDDSKLYSDAMKEVQSVIDSSTNARVAKGMGYSSIARTKQEGYCIRCGTSIPHNLDAPYCPACFEVWAKWKNPDYDELYCHTCGDLELTTMAKPQCYSCYIRSQR